MKLPANDELKKMTPQERQNFITSALTELRGRYDNPRLNKYIDTILKVYLLECGEGIDVDFSKDEMSPTELWLHELTKNITEISKHVNEMSTETKRLSEDLFDAHTKFDESFTKDLKNKMSNFAERLRKCFSNNYYRDIISICDQICEYYNSTKNLE